MIYDSMNAYGVAYWSMGPELVAEGEMETRVTRLGGKG